MKIKLTPELSYIIGLWRKRKSFDGLGVRGEGQTLEVFTKEALDRSLITPEKIITTDEQVFFYHTAYRKFFQEVEKGQLERFRYLNEYAANYLAGMFDAAGEIDSRGIVSIHRCSTPDEMLLLRLGFPVRRTGQRLILERPLVFLAFIKNYVKITKGHKIFEYVKGSAQAREETDKAMIMKRVKEKEAKITVKEEKVAANEDKVATKEEKVVTVEE